MACCSASRWCCTSRTRWPAWPTGAGRRGRPRVHRLPQRAARRRSGSAIRCARRSCSSQGRPSALPAAAGRCSLLVVGGSLGARALNDDRAAGAGADRPRTGARWSRTRAAPSRSTSCAPTTPPPASRPSSRPSSTTPPAPIADGRPHRLPRRRQHRHRDRRRRRGGRCSCRFPRRWTTTRPPTPASWCEAGGGWLVQQRDLTPQWLAELLQNTGAPRAGRAGAKGQKHAKNRMRRRRSGPRVRGAGSMKHAIHHIHFVGIGGAGMSGIAEVLLNLGYAHLGLRPGRQRHAAPPAGAGHRHLRRPRGRAHRRRRRRRHLDGGAGRQPRGGGRARQEDSRGAARADAGRADAPQAGHRDRRHARQDHHHQPGGQRAGRGRARPDLRDRRPPEQRRRQRAAGQRRLHRGRGRRVRCLVPEPAARDGRGHEHRRRPHGDLRPRLRAGSRRPSSTSCTACRSMAWPSCAPTTRPCARSCPRCTCPVTSYGFDEDAQVRAVNVRARRRPDALHGAARATASRCPTSTSC